MTKMSTQTISESVLDAYSNNVQLGDRALDLNSGCMCVVLDHIPELGPESLYVQLVEHDGPAMSYWVSPDQLVKLPRNPA
jgi:hypothetical protein